jgi:hypothetical protein
MSNRFPRIIIDNGLFTMMMTRAIRWGFPQSPPGTFVFALGWFRFVLWAR